MLVNHHLIRLCEAILNNTIEGADFGNLLVEARLKLDENEKEWDIANNLLKKSDEIAHTVGGRDRKTVH